MGAQRHKLTTGNLHDGRRSKHKFILGIQRYIIWLALPTACQQLQIVAIIVDNDCDNLAISKWYRTYGVPRVAAQLRKNGVKVSVNRVRI